MSIRCTQPGKKTTAALTHCQMALFVQFAIAADSPLDSGPLSIPCRWAFLLGSERGFGAARWRFKGTGNRCRLTSPLSQKSVGEVCTISDSAWIGYYATILEKNSPLR